MAIIVVGGSSRGAGKTTLVCGLLAALPEYHWNVVKITTHDHGQLSPIWEETRPGDESDTARYLAAGAVRAFLATPPMQADSPEPDLAPLLDELWPNFRRGTNLIFESNSVVHHVRPNVCLMVHAISRRELPLPQRKPSFLAALGHADAMVAPSNEDEVIADGLCLAGQQPKPIFHLASLGHLSPEMLTWIRRLLDPGLSDPSPTDRAQTDRAQTDSPRHDPSEHSSSGDDPSLRS